MRRKATFAIDVDLLKELKLFSKESADPEFLIVERALTTYLRKRTKPGE